MTSPVSVFDSILGAIQKAADYNRDETVPPAAVLWTDEKREWETLVASASPGAAALPRLRPLRRSQPNRPGDLAALRPGREGARDHLADDGVCRSFTCPVSAERHCGPPRSARTNSSRWPSSSTGACSGPRSTARTGPSPRSCRPNHGGLQPEAGQGYGHGDVDPPQPRKAGRCAHRRTAGQVRRWRTEQQLLRLTDQRRPDRRSAFLALRPEGHTRPLGAGPLGDAVQPVLADYGFDPARDGEIAGAELLGVQEKAAWKTAWKRYAAMPARYPGLLELLRKAKPKPKAGDLAAGRSLGALAAGQRGLRGRAAEVPAPDCRGAARPRHGRR